MGVPEHHSPVYLLTMRHSRGRLVAVLAVLGLLCFTVFLFGSAHTALRDAEGATERCKQLQDSLSAQLQVAYEHKSRLEKSLQQEREGHLHTKEENEKLVFDVESKFQKEKVERERLEAELQSVRTRLQGEVDVQKEQLHSLQTQRDAETEKLQNHIEDLLVEKDKLEQSHNMYNWKIEQCNSELSLCHLQLNQTQTELGTCRSSPQIQDSPEPKAGGALKPLEEVTNVTSLPEVKLLEKPVVIQSNLGDGVLPKPVDPLEAKNEVKPNEMANADLDAAIEQVDARPAADVPARRKDEDNAGERGEDGLQYVHNELKAAVPKEVGDAEAQMRDMMDRSPGEVRPDHVLREPPLQDRKIEARAPENEEDDDDREEDEHQNAHMLKLPDNDFDDQENIDNAKEEGVIVDPK